MKLSLQKLFIFIGFLVMLMWTIQFSSAATTIAIDANDFNSYSGYAVTMARPEAANKNDVQLSTGSALNYLVTLQPYTRYIVAVRYSNDGGADNIKLGLGPRKFANFFTYSTGTGGYGWNNFVYSPSMSVVTGPASLYNFNIQIPYADNLVEIDQIIFYTA